MTKALTMMPAVLPSQQQSYAYQAMFDYLNAELFGGELPGVILNFSRHSGAYGFFAPERWKRGGDTTHEISLNPSHLTREPIATAATLVHEMCHLWQHVFGAPSRRGYHNAEWAAKMEEVGLTPSDTAAPGGRKVGQAVSHYITAGGRFEQTFTRMPKAYLLPWVHIAEQRAAAPTGPGAEGGTAAGAAPAKSRNKVKYSCPKCSSNVWGKPGLAVACVPCVALFAEVA